MNFACTRNWRRNTLTWLEDTDKPQYCNAKAFLPSDSFDTIGWPKWTFALPHEARCAAVRLHSSRRKLRKTLATTGFGLKGTYSTKSWEQITLQRRGCSHHRLVIGADGNGKSHLLREVANACHRLRGVVTIHLNAQNELHVVQNVLQCAPPTSLTLWSDPEAYFTAPPETETVDGAHCGQLSRSVCRYDQ